MFLKRFPAKTQRRKEETLLSLHLCASAGEISGNRGVALFGFVYACVIRMKVDDSSAYNRRDRGAYHATAVERRVPAL